MQARQAQTGALALLLKLQVWQAVAPAVLLKLLLLAECWPCWPPGEAS